MTFFWELREEVRDTSEYAHDSLMEHMRDGGSPSHPRVLALYSTLALARAALSTRLRPLFGGGDCFTVPCHDKLEMQQRWEADGSGEVAISVKKPPGEPHYHYSSNQLVLAVTPSQTVVDQPPSEHDLYDWDDLLSAIRPPPPPLTAEEQAAQMLRLDEEWQQTRLIEAAMRQHRAAQRRA
jgi:hypothetical protein